MPMKICFVIIITIWLSAALLTLPYGIFMGIIPSESRLYCDEEWPFDESRKAFGISTSVLQFVIPFFIITFCYVRVCGKLWDRARARPGSVSMRREEMERERTRKTNGMLISMVVIFVISWLPLNTYNLVFNHYFCQFLCHKSLLKRRTKQLIETNRSMNAKITEYSQINEKTF